MTTNKSDERRNSFRLPFNAKVICYIGPDNEKYIGQMHDISADGFSMKIDNCPDIGIKCGIEIIIDGTNSRLIIDKLNGKIIRKIDDGVAVCFDNKLEWLALVPIYFQKIRENY